MIWIDVKRILQVPLGRSPFSHRAVRVNWVFHPSSGYKTLCAFYFIVIFIVAETGEVFIKPVLLPGPELDCISEPPWHLGVAMWLTVGQ